jgi:DNA-binding transcriptional LysR family regulator
MLTSSTVRAAELMHITQPAVSRLVRELQDTLALTLFERVGNRLRPTPDARALYAEVERSFVGLDRIAQAAGELALRRAGTLRIAAMPALCNGILPRFVGEFLASRQRLDLELYGMSSQSVVDWVVSEQCDLGFAAAPIEQGAVTVRKMPAVQYVAVVPRGHRLSKRAVIRAPDLNGENFVALGASTRSRFRIDDVLARHGATPKTRVKTPLSEIACALVAAGVGVSIVESFTAHEFASRGLLVKRFEPKIEFQVAALCSSGRDLAPVANEFVERFAEHMEKFRRSACGL